MPKLPDDRVADLAAGLTRAIAEAGWSARGLAAAAGLGPDAVRNATRGLSGTLRGDRLERLAVALGISPAALTGERPWPRRRLRLAPAAEPAQRVRRGGTMTVREVDLRTEAPGSGPDVLDRPTAATWIVPRDAIPSSVKSGDLVMVRSPSEVPGRGIKVGDRLLVDVGDRTGRPWLSVIRDGHGYALAAVRGASVQIWKSSKNEQVGLAEVGVVGHVVGRWAWL